ncbi:protein-export chaperone SecB [Bartonella sp. DGB1]|uniref:protein-export chaperone SecB n=1 Tax=Bartonella sp. DGB1 TaxID=3239807 RepID=UPI003525F221
MSEKKVTTEEQNKVASFTVLKQYIKDLSFENPHATEAMYTGNISPSASINVNVDATKLSENELDHEVVLTFNAKAQHENLVLFNIELSYAGIFRLENIPEEQVKPLLLIEGARLLFPFARHLISATTSEGGYMPLLLEPVNFAALYQSTLEAQQNATPNKEQK